MPLLPYVNRLEPVEDAVIWRCLDLRKFRDLMASEELYFRRADLFTDKSEAVPPEQYAARVLRLDPYDIRDRQQLDHHLGSMAQHRVLYRQRWESCRMGPEGIPSLAEVQRLERTLRAFRAALRNAAD